MSEALPLDAAYRPDNVFMLSCEHRKLRTCYGMCLQLHNGWRQGASLRGDVGGCEAAFQRGDCPAQKLRTEEQDAGQALHYIKGIGVRVEPAAPGFNFRDEHGLKTPRSDDPSYLRGWHALERRALQGGYAKGEQVVVAAAQTGVGKSKIAAPSEFFNPTMADAVTAMVADAAAAARPVVTATQKVAPTPVPTPKVVIAHTPKGSATSPLLELARKAMENRNA